MKPMNDEAFLELAHKVAAGIATSEEAEQVRLSASTSPERAALLARLHSQASLAKDILRLINATEATEPRLPEHLRRRLQDRLTAAKNGELVSFKAALAQRREEQRGRTPKVSVTAQAEATPLTLSAKELEILLLRVLSERPMDGFDLANSLRKARVTALEGGEGTIYGLLTRLEASGCVQGRWRPDGGRMAKSYFVTEKGTTLLRGSKALFANLEDVSRHILAADGSGV